MTATTPRPLPRGPHSLSRDQVARAQRERLLHAITECVASKGYAQTAVADVLARSGVSRATFYQLFTDKEDCYCAAYQQAITLLRQALAASPAAPAGTAQAALTRVDNLLTVYLAQLASQPDAAKAFMVEVHAAGLRANTQRQAVIAAFIDQVLTLLAGHTAHLGPAEDQRFAISCFVHGMISLVTSMISVGDSARLPELREPLRRLAGKLME